MSTLEAVWLGIVQGLTEFFPVSSSGHLVLFQNVLGIHLDDLVFDVAVHVATAVAILGFYHGKVWALIRGVLLREDDALRYTGKLALGTLPAVVVGLFLPFTVSISEQILPPGSIRVGETIPTFSAPDDRGEMFDSARLRGNPVLIKFFRAHW